MRVNLEPIRDEEIDPLDGYALALRLRASKAQQPPPANVDPLDGYATALDRRAEAVR